jgi:mono/diheme cytochrome c family protein
VLRRLVIVGMAAAATSLLYAQQAPPAGPASHESPPTPQPNLQTQAPAGAGTPVGKADATPKGQLKNPYSDSDQAVVQAGSGLYLRYGCNGCHGGNGGGGMCPPLTNDVWVYGGDDDTLFRLVAYGSEALQGKGYSRKGTESVVGPMPPMGQVVQTDDDLWRILAFVRSNYHGAPECKFGCGASQ